jgi:anti-sigma regulatory factor (Ser/Thr protein kinase)
MMRITARNNQYAIVALDKFIQATRDSGYKNTASAISELVDNSIQAGATKVAISVMLHPENEKAIDVCVLDDGCGMDPFTLQQALRFGGSSRFGDRSGLGRYGMGLPNASLSQTRRVTVYTWQSLRQDYGGISKRRSRVKQEVPDRIYRSYLDVDEIIRGEMVEVPRPKLVSAPITQFQTASGTLVVWNCCDRLDSRRISTITRKLGAELGRRFRHFLWKGLTITINGDSVRPFDPLYLHSDTEVAGARPFGEELRYEIAVNGSEPSKTGWVLVRFSELPVDEWHRLSNEEKRRIGVSKGAGVSIVRANREVDYGWFFMGEKRRENYDDWWRCEIQFDPVLDDVFGISHTKQQIRPQPHVMEALTPDLEATARALNSRARKAYLAVKVGERFSDAERVASGCDRLLPPLPRKSTPQSKSLMHDLERNHPSLRRRSETGAESKYRIVEDSVKDMRFFSHAFDGERLVLVVNPDHPFYREIYKPLADGDSPQHQQLRAKIELLLLAAARSEVANSSRETSELLSKYRQEWSNTLAAFLNAR